MNSVFAVVPGSAKIQAHFTSFSRRRGMQTLGLSKRFRSSKTLKRLFCRPDHSKVGVGIMKRFVRKFASIASSRIIRGGHSKALRFEIQRSRRDTQRSSGRVLNPQLSRPPMSHQVFGIVLADGICPLVKQDTGWGGIVAAMQQTTLCNLHDRLSRITRSL